MPNKRTPYVFLISKLFPTSTFLLGTVRLLDLSQEQNYGSFLQKLQWIQSAINGFFCPVLLFGPVRLLFFQNFPPRTFIRHLRVYHYGLRQKRQYMDNIAIVFMTQGSDTF